MRFSLNMALASRVPRVLQISGLSFWTSLKKRAAAVAGSGQPDFEEFAGAASSGFRLGRTVL